jgi:hypothetical protein
MDLHLNLILDLLYGQTNISGYRMEDLIRKLKKNHHMLLLTPSATVFRSYITSYILPSKTLSIDSRSMMGRQDGSATQPYSRPFILPSQLIRMPHKSINPQTKEEPPHKINSNIF